ncbi:MAG: PTS glucose transporter subunit IIA [Treponema sp.]|jgi:glucose-specific phosphotransferase system IIA component|nr:PTS glucose transporter subunit IIA [Treponema sp.]
MFSLHKKRPPAGAIYATQDGKVLPIEEMPDEVFAGRALGNGICIVPSNDKVYAPVEGVIESIADSHHAFGITASDGADIVIHIGVDTVELSGRGFKPKVRLDQRVKAGDLLCQVDLALLRKAGYAIHTAVLLANLDAFKIVEFCYGDAAGGKTVAFRYQKLNTTETSGEKG